MSEAHMRRMSAEAREEYEALSLDAPETTAGLHPVAGRGSLKKRAISAPDVLNEAYDYAAPATFTRGMRVELPGASMLYLSGTASVDENGLSVHPGDFAAQWWRTYRNLTHLLAAEHASWHDIFRT
ncbi:MAG: hypothetical protein OEV00_11160, partial [Acidobacteriota bacterium]|nr:hypothetical protein [Acidobacteriota bacterium]